SVLSHELRTPLTIVIGYASLMTTIGKFPVVDDLRESLRSNDTRDGEDLLDTLIATTEEMASKAQRSAQHLLSLLNHLLDFSKLEAGKMRLDMMDLKVASVLDDIDHSFREIIEAKGLRFDVSGIEA